MFYTIHHFIRVRFETRDGDEGGFLFISLLLFCLANSTLSVPLPVPRGAGAPSPSALSAFLGTLLRRGIPPSQFMPMRDNYNKFAVSLQFAVVCYVLLQGFVRRGNMYGLGAREDEGGWLGDVCGG